ncbi:MAG: NAD(P)/FAD-dependent oxidoreductase [Candidatus Cloacimonadales bacterium]|nr:NAD(P)/FAD-dependent oxidoreductase [Candidatus Cloacimonadales bacterium]
MYQIRNIIIPISKQPDLFKVLSRTLNLPIEAIEDIKILHSSLDARVKNHLKFNLTLNAKISAKLDLNNDVQIYHEPEPYLQETKKISDPHPFIIGAGPAGLFAALALVEKGFQPYVFDRGDCLEKRSQKVADFWKNGVLNEESNVQFGEGGAGTFSDGKLTSRKSDFYTNQVTKYLLKFGAKAEINYEALPHLGTDGIHKIVLNIRKYLESKGCKFFWNHKFEEMEISNDRISTITVNGETHKPEIVILAIGNAARDTFEMLSQKTVLESKPFAVGFRIEHPQDFINETFYGIQNDFSISGPATYRLTAKALNRGVYSFCMCPGGQIIVASSEKNSVVTNGMSSSGRNGKFANSAIVVSVNEHDYGTGLLAGMEFQRNIEQKCFIADQPYFAPFQSAKDFMKALPTKRKIETSYNPGVHSSDLNAIYSSEIANAIKTGMKVFEKRAPGFIEKGIFIAPETRTSSPVRILRDNVTFCSQRLSNLFPCGEGSGYAGGIMSSAADGFKVGSIFKK